MPDRAPPPSLPPSTLSQAPSTGSAPLPPGPAPRRRRWRRHTIEILVFVAGFIAIQAWQARDVPSGPAPAFDAPMASGQTGSLEAWRSAHPGKVTAVYFWAEWCPVCTAQQGTIDSLQRDHPVLTVAMQSGDAATVANELAARELAWPTVIDADGRITASYGLRGVPALVVIDPDGNIRSVAVGYTTALGMRARLWWAGLTS